MSETDQTSPDAAALNAAAPLQAPAPPGTAHRPAHHWGVLIAFLVAVGLIFWADRLLRARQNLVSGLLAKDVRVLIPFSEYLTEHAEKKNTWNKLHERIARGIAVNDQKDFLAASYALAEFIAVEMSPDDPRRREV